MISTSFPTKRAKHPLVFYYLILYLIRLAWAVGVDKHSSCVRRWRRRLPSQDSGRRRVWIELAEERRRYASSSFLLDLVWSCDSSASGSRVSGLDRWWDRTRMCLKTNVSAFIFMSGGVSGPAIIVYLLLWHNCLITPSPCQPLPVDLNFCSCVKSRFRNKGVKMFLAVQSSSIPVPV